MQNTPTINPRLKQLVMARKQTLFDALRTKITPRKSLEELVALVLGATNDGRAYATTEWAAIDEEDFLAALGGEVNEELIPQFSVIARKDLTKYLDTEEILVIPSGGPDILPVFVKDQGAYGALVLPIAEDVRRFLARRSGPDRRAS
jgi:hypothetical protein